MDSVKLAVSTRIETLGFIRHGNQVSLTVKELPEYGGDQLGAAGASGARHTALAGKQTSMRVIRMT